MNWITGGSRGPRPPKKVQPVKVAIGDRIVIPDKPHFYPGQISRILRVQRSMVKYWIDNHKLDAERDFDEVPYVARGVLVTFIREYLQKECE